MKVLFKAIAALAIGLALTLGLLPGQTASANAAPGVAAVAPASELGSALSPASVIGTGFNSSIGDCVAASKVVWGTPYQKVAAAVRSWGCGSTLGSWNVNFICWADDQWWGGYFRWGIWMITGGQYSRC